MKNAIKTQNSNLKIIIGKRLKELRDKHRYSQAELGYLIGVHSNTIYNYEHGIVLPPIGVLYDLAKVFKVSIDSLTETDSITNAEFEGGMKLSLETFQHALVLDQEVDFNQLSDLYIKNIEEEDYRIRYEFKHNLAGVDPSNLRVIKLTRYNEILKAPAGAYVIVEETKDMKDIDISKPTYVLIYDEIEIADEADESQQRTFKSQYFSRITPIKEANEFTFINGEYLSHKFLFFSPFNNEEHVVGKRWLKSRIAGFVKKVIIDY